MIFVKIRSIAALVDFLKSNIQIVRTQKDRRHVAVGQGNICSQTSIRKIDNTGYPLNGALANSESPDET